MPRRFVLPCAIFGASLLLLVYVLVATGAEGDEPHAPTVIGQGPPSTLRLPQALAFTRDGTMLVGDQFSGSLRRFDASGRALSPLVPRGGKEPLLGAISGVAVAPDGSTYVTVGTTSTVVQMDANGRIRRSWGGLGPGRKQLHFATGAIGSGVGGGIAVGGGKLWIADTLNSRIVRYDLDGSNPRVIRMPRTTRSDFPTPQGIAYARGHVFVPDDVNGNVLELTTSGKLVRRSAVGGFDHPYDIAVLPDGKLAVADNSNHRVVVLDEQLHVVRRFGKFGKGRLDFVYPRGIAIDPAGRIAVADSANGRVTIATSAGRFVRTLGRDARGAGTLTQPEALVADPHGELRIADTITGRVIRFDFSGRALGSIGVPQGMLSPEVRDGRLLSPDSLAVLPGGDLAVADTSGLSRFNARGDFEARIALAPGSKQPAAIATAPGGAIAMLERRPDRIVVLGQPTKRTAIQLTTAKLDGSATFAIASDGSAWLVQRRPGRAIHVGADGKLIGSFALPAMRGRPPRRTPAVSTGPGGIAVEADGSVWIANGYTDRVDHYAADGKSLGGWGGSGTDPGRFDGPTAVVVDCAGGVSVTDTGNSRVQRFADAAADTGCDKALPPTPAGHRVPAAPTVSAKATPKDSGFPITVRASCVGRCTITATATASGGVDFLKASRRQSGKRPALASTPPLPLRVTRRGSTFVVDAGPSRRALLRFANGGPFRVLGVQIAIAATGANSMKSIRRATATLDRIG